MKATNCQSCCSSQPTVEQKKGRDLETLEWDITWRHLVPSSHAALQVRLESNTAYKFKTTTADSTARRQLRGVTNFWARRIASNVDP